MSNGKQTPWEKASVHIDWLLNQQGVAVKGIEETIRQACEEHAAAKDAQIAKLNEEIKWRQEHMEKTDHEICQMEDWLCGNAEFDKNGLIDKAARCKERIRDLIAAEGALGDKDAQIAGLLARVEAMREALEKARRAYRAEHARNTEELHTLPTPYCKALSDSPPPALVPLEEVKGLVEALADLLGAHVWGAHNWTETGHLGICSAGFGDPTKCPVCGNTVRAKNALEAWRTKHP